MDRIQLALVTDMPFLRPTLVAMMSAIAHASRPVDVHMLGDTLTEDAREMLASGCRAFPGTRLVHHDITDLLVDSPAVGKWPRSAIGPLLIPGFVDGRALNLDSDTITHADVAPLFDLNMNGHPIAAVRDFSILNDIRKGVVKEKEYFETVSRAMDPFYLHDNFNCGVMLMDCEKIRKSDGYRDGMIGRDMVATCRVDDQTALNSLFKGSVVFLGPEWNCFWGESRRAHKVMRATLPEGSRPPTRARPKIIHFKGSMKPWNIQAKPHARLSTWLRFGPATLSYHVRAWHLSRMAKRVHGRNGPSADKSSSIYGAVSENQEARSIQVSFATDATYLRPTLVAMASVIAHADRPVVVHLLGDGLSGPALEAFAAICAEKPGTALAHHDVTDMLPERFDSKYWSRAALARLLIPNLIEGRVLHLDSDTMAFSNVGPLFDLDLQGNPIAVVRDFGALHWIAKRHLREGKRRFQEMRDLMTPYPMHDYFNSGVMLIDTDRIRSDVGLLEMVTDIKQATERDYPDQDLLNLAFKGRAVFLDPCWNSIYGRVRFIYRVARAVLPDDLLHRPLSPRIAHFVYDPKPFNPIGWKHWQKTSFFFRLLPMLVRYRLNARRLLHPVRDTMKRI